MVSFIKITGIIIASLLTVSVLSACSGFSAKRKPVSLYELKYSVDNQKEVLQHYIDSAQHQLLYLEKSTKGRCLNGQLIIANNMFDIALKEHKNALYNDAFITLTNFDRQIRKTRCILAYVEGEFGCQHTNKSSVLKRWYQQGSYQQCAISKNKPLIDKYQKQQLKC